MRAGGRVSSGAARALPRTPRAWGCGYGRAARPREAVCWRVAAHGRAARVLRSLAFATPSRCPPSTHTLRLHCCRAQATLLDEYEYGMCGKVFKYEYLEDRKV